MGLQCAFQPAGHLSLTVAPPPSPQVQLAKMADFPSALVAIAGSLQLVVVEQIEESASLYGSSIGSHHVCLLVKAGVSPISLSFFLFVYSLSPFFPPQAGNTLSINAKGSNAQLVSSLLDEIKNLV